MKGIWKKISVVLVVVLCFFFAYMDKAEAETTTGSVYFGKLFGITRNNVVNHLETEGATLYLGTPYASGSSGTSRQPGIALNCAAFISEVMGHAYRDAGHGQMSDFLQKFEDMLGDSAWKDSSGNVMWPECVDCSASNWYKLAKKHNAIVKNFGKGNAGKQALLKEAKKGDIILMWVGDPQNGTLEGDNHMGIYWGNNGEDKMWHSKTPENMISEIQIKSGDPDYILIPLENESYSFTIQKRDYSNHTAGVAGVEFELYKSDQVTPATHSDGTPVGTLTTPDSGNITVSNLAAGNYYLKEVSTPNGWTILPVPIPIRISSSGVATTKDPSYDYWELSGTTLTVYNTKHSIVPKPTTFTITISKKDITTKDELPGAKIEIKDKDGKEVISFVSGPEEKRITLKAGVYTLKETATPSPLQSCLDNLKEDQERESCNYNPIETELQFEVTSDGKVKLLSKKDDHYQIDGTKITVFNDTTPVLKVPDTGAGQTILLVLMGLLTLGSGAFLVYQNTKRKQL